MAENLGFDKFIEVHNNLRDGMLDVAIFRLNKSTGAYSPNRYRLSRSSFGARNLTKFLAAARYSDWKQGLFGSAVCYYQ